MTPGGRRENDTLDLMRLEDNVCLSGNHSWTKWPVGTIPISTITPYWTMSNANGFIAGMLFGGSGCCDWMEKQKIWLSFKIV